MCWQKCNTYNVLTREWSGNRQNAKTIDRAPPMNVGRQKITPHILLVFAVIVTLLSLSVVFYQQRIGYEDTAGYLITMVRNNKFNIAHSRFISVCSQWFPLILLSLGASFKSLAISYSVTNIFFPVLLALICLFVFKNTYKALAILIYWVLLNTWLFYYTCSEVPLGMALLIFFDAFTSYVLANKKKQSLFIAGAVLMLPTILFSHPMNILVIFGWITYRIIKEQYHFRKEYLVVSVVTIAAYIIKQLFFVSSYEVEKAPKLAIISKFSFDIYTGTLASSFYKNVADDTFLVPVLLLITIIALIARRKAMLAAFVFLAATGFFTLVLLVFQKNGETFYNQYYEHLMQPVVFFIVLAFTDSLGDIFKSRWPESVLLVAVFGISICKIITGSEPITKRHAWYRQKFSIMDQCGIRKALISKDELPEGETKASYWNAGDETLFLSAIAGAEHCKTICVFWPWLKEQSLQDGNNDYKILYDGFIKPIWEFPVRYFKLGSDRYILIERDSCIR